MGPAAIMRNRLSSNFRSLGGSLRTMLQARKKLPKTKSSIYLLLMLLPIVSVVFIDNPVFALTWIVCLFIYLPIIEAYAYAVVYNYN